MISSSWWMLGRVIAATTADRVSARTYAPMVWRCDRVRRLLIRPWVRFYRFPALPGG